MQDDEKYKKIKEALDRLHKQKQNSKENSNSQTLDNNKTVNNQNLNLKNINLSNSKNNLKNQPNLQNNTNKNFKNSDNDLNFNKNKSSSNSINQRDYDKDPLVIKDYNSEVSGVWLLFVVVFLIAVFASGQISLHASGVAVVTILIYIGKTDENSPKNGVFKFTSEYIYYSSDIKCKEIKLNEISKISNTLQALYEVRNETKKGDLKQKIGNIGGIFYLIILVLGFIFVDEYRKPLIIVFSIFILGFIAPQYLYHLYKDSTLKKKVFDTLVISSKFGFNICIFFARQSDYDEIRKYFLYKKGIDIKNV